MIGSNLPFVTPKACLHLSSCSLLTPFMESKAFRRRTEIGLAEAKIQRWLFCISTLVSQLSKRDLRSPQGGLHMACVRASTIGMEAFLVILSGQLEHRIRSLYVCLGTGRNSTVHLSPASECGLLKRFLVFDQNLLHWFCLLHLCQYGPLPFFFFFNGSRCGQSFMEKVLVFFGSYRIWHPKTILWVLVTVCFNVFHFFRLILISLLKLLYQTKIQVKSEQNCTWFHLEVPPWRSVFLSVLVFLLPVMQLHYSASRLLG